MIRAEFLVYVQWVHSALRDSMMYYAIRGRTAQAMTYTLCEILGSDGYSALYSFALTYCAVCIAWNAAILTILSIHMRVKEGDLEISTAAGGTFRAIPKTDGDAWALQSNPMDLVKVLSWEKMQTDADVSHILWRLPITFLLEPQAVYLPFGAEISESSSDSTRPLPFLLLRVLDCPAFFVGGLMTSEIYRRLQLDSLVTSTEFWLIFLSIAISFNIWGVLVKIDGVRISYSARRMLMKTMVLTVPYATAMALTDMTVKLSLETIFL